MRLPRPRFIPLFHFILFLLEKKEKGKKKKKGRQIQSSETRCFSLSINLLFTTKKLNQLCPKFSPFPRSSPITALHHGERFFLFFFIFLFYFLFLSSVLIVEFWRICLFLFFKAVLDLWCCNFMRWKSKGDWWCRFWFGIVCFSPPIWFLLVDLIYLWTFDLWVLYFAMEILGCWSLVCVIFKLVFLKKKIKNLFIIFEFMLVFLFYFIILLFYFFLVWDGPRFYSYKFVILFCSCG